MDNVMKSLGSLLGVNEITARTFTAQSACDIASRSVEFFQLLERLARDGDTICQALENQAVAQKKLTMTLRLILPHIKAYFAEQQADKQVLEAGLVRPMLMPKPLKPSVCVRHVDETSFSKESLSPDQPVTFPNDAQIGSPCKDSLPTPSGWQGKEVRVPPPVVGTTVVAKFGVGENAEWREGVIRKRSINSGNCGITTFDVLCQGQVYRGKKLHQLAVVEPAKECDLRIKDVVVGWYGNLGTRFSGVVAETPVKENGHRVLVFFYDGFAQYLPPSRLHLCYLWDKITLDTVYRSMAVFFRDYFSQYPKRLMIRLREGDTVQLERFRDVLEARVVEVDCSLVKLHFKARGSSAGEAIYEWLYRGSVRLAPVFLKKDGRMTAIDALYTFTDDLFDHECPPVTTPPDNTGIYPWTQTPVEEHVPAVSGVARMSSPSGMQHSSSVQRANSSELENISSQVQSNLCNQQLHCDLVTRLPRPPIARHMAEDSMPPRRKRAAVVQGNSAAKKSRSHACIDEICEHLVTRCVDQRSQSTHVSTSLPAASINVCNSNSGTIMTVGSDADDEDYILLPPVNLKNLCARHWGFGVSSELERRNSSSVVVISDSDIC